MQPSSCLSTVINVFFCFGWRKVWSSFYSWGSANPCAVSSVYVLSGNTAHGVFLISRRSNKATFETLCEDEGFSELKSWIRCGSLGLIIPLNVFMSAEKTRARLFDLERNARGKDSFMQFLILFLVTFLFQTAVARYRFELMNVMLIWGSSKNERPWVTECYYCTVQRYYQHHLHFWLSSVLVSYS